MDIMISNGTGKSIHEQVTAQVKAMIISGEPKVEDAIPSMRALAKSVHVSAAIAQRAYEELQRDGFIETTVGRGSFVSAQNEEPYQKGQQCIVEEHLQVAAEIDRANRTSLEKLKELLALLYLEDG